MKKIILALLLPVAILMLHSCGKTINGCTDPTANNYTPDANNDNGTCTYLYVGQSIGGGVIGYLLQPGDAGYSASQVHGLIVAPANNVPHLWGCTGDSIVTSNLLGTGQTNTSAILSLCTDTSTAASYCDKLVTSDNYNDWYLPSKDELLKIYPNKVAAGGFAIAFYWTSSQVDANHATIVTFNNGMTASIKKDSTIRVRAVRSF